MLHWELCLIHYNLLRLQSKLWHRQSELYHSRASFGTTEKALVPQSITEQALVPQSYLWSCKSYLWPYRPSFGPLYTSKATCGTLDLALGPLELALALQSYLWSSYNYSWLFRATTCPFIATSSHAELPIPTLELVMAHSEHILVSPERTLTRRASSSSPSLSLALQS